MPSKGELRKGCLCINVVGSECMVLFDDEKSKPQVVNASDLKLAAGLSIITESEKAVFRNKQDVWLMFSEEIAAEKRLSW